MREGSTFGSSEVLGLACFVIRRNLSDAAWSCLDSLIALLRDVNDKYLDLDREQNLKIVMALYERVSRECPRCVLETKAA